VTHGERVKLVGDSIHKAYIERQVAALLPVREMAEAAIAAIFETLEISDEMVNAVYALRWRGHTPVDTGCAINDAKALIHQELETALKVMR
jgi:riboflavin synthase